ncbi:hypothetical protein D3C73_1083420 [compost metagenome]
MTSPERFFILSPPTCDVVVLLLRVQSAQDDQAHNRYGQTEQNQVIPRLSSVRQLIAAIRPPKRKLIVGQRCFRVR